MYKILSFVLLLFFIGCGGSASKKVETSHLLEPKVVISDVNLTSNVLKGKLKLIENDDFYSDVLFKNIKLSNDICNITNLKLDKNEVKNSETVSFTANVNCSYIDKLNISFEEYAKYMDTSIKTVKKSFVLNYPVNVGKKANGTNNIPVKLGIATVQPSSITINTGDSYVFTVYTFDKNNNPVSVPVKIDPPVINGKLIGEFDKYSLETDKNGKGTFTYTAPKNINENNISVNVNVSFNNEINKTINITVKKNTKIILMPTKLIIVPQKITLSAGAKYNIKIFTLDDNNRGISSKVIISHPIDKYNESWGTFDEYSLNTNENGEAEITFTATNDVEKLKDENLSVSISVETTSLTTNLLLEKPKLIESENTIYKIDYIVPDSVEVNNKFNLSIKILNSKTNELINEENINEVNFTSENHLIYFDNNVSKFSKNLFKLNPISIQAHSGIFSGIDVIDVNVSIKEGDKNKVISSQIPVIIVSGPVSAISINSLGVTFNTKTGLFEKTYTIHAVDKYSNPVKAGTKIKVGAVVNAKLVGNGGTLNNNSDKFKDTKANFSNDLIENSLIVFADSTHKDPSYLGGWIVENVLDTNTLQLASIYKGNNVNNLSYVIGNEKKYINCESTLAVADFDSSDKTYETDNQGIAKVILKYDPYLVGHTVSLYANSYQDKRVGISVKNILIGNNILFYEPNDDDTKHKNDGLWNKYESKDTNISDNIYVGVKGGPYSTILGDGTTLLENISVNIKILTPSICEFDDKSIYKTIFTSCNGAINFKVHYKDSGTCQVQFDGINYEY